MVQLVGEVFFGPRENFGYLAKVLTDNRQTEINSCGFEVLYSSVKVFLIVVMLLAARPDDPHRNCLSLGANRKRLNPRRVYRRLVAYFVYRLKRLMVRHTF